MKTLKIVLVAATMMAAYNATAQDVSAVNAKFTEAAEALKAKNFTTAIEKFEAVMNEGMETEGAEALVTEAQKAIPTAMFQAGGQLFQTGNLDEALELFSKAAQRAELYGNLAVLNNARTWIGRTVLRQGADAFNAKDYATAAAIFEKGYAGNPNDTTVAMNLAMSYVGMGDYEKGNEVYRAIMALGTQDSRFQEAAAQAATKFAEDNLIRANEAAGAQNLEGAAAILDEILAAVPTDEKATALKAQIVEFQKAAAAAQ